MYSVITLLEKRIVRRPNSFSVLGGNPRHRFNLSRHKRDVLPFVTRRYATNEESNDSGRETLFWPIITSIAIGSGTCAQASPPTGDRTVNTCLRFCGNRRKRFAHPLCHGRTRRFCSLKLRPNPFSKLD